MLIRVLLLFILFGVNGCSSSLAVKSLPHPQTESLLFKVSQLHPKKEASLLSVQFESHQWRWVQTDPIGSPLARLILSTQGWQNDGFVMPNSQAQQLFSALATALYGDGIFAFSQIQPHSQTTQYFINQRFVWQISQHSPLIDIQLADKSQWQIEELAQ